MKLDKPLSVTVFRRLARQLTAEQLLALPTACLPDSIPLDAVDGEREPGKWAALEKLVWRATERDMAQRSEDLERLGPVAGQALDLCETETPAGADELAALCEALTAPCREGGPVLDPLSDTSQGLERANVRARTLAERVGQLSRALATLERACSDHELGATPRVDRARRHARSVLARLESALGRFHMLELELAGTEMRARASECDLQVRRVEELDERIAAVEAQLERDNGVVVRLIRPRVARRQREAREQRLEALRQSRDCAEIFIDEDHLLRWLDVLVNTCLFSDQEHWQQRAHDVRMLLFRLLNTYCLQQELAAQQVATRAIPGIDGRAAIHYYIRSEEFILRYFARKRDEVMQWLSGAAEHKLAQLEYTRDALLAEYRRQAGRDTDGVAAGSGDNGDV